jgi:hypothetical protein
MIAMAPHIQPQPFKFLSPTTVPLDYIESTIPADMTLREYRRSLPRSASRWRRLKQLAGAAR